MEKFREYFNTFEVLKSKKNIIDDIQNLFPSEKINESSYKKIIDFYLKDDTLKEISDKRKRFFISKKFLLDNNLTIEEIFNKDKFGILYGKGNFEKRNTYFLDFIKDDAIIEVKLSEVLI